MRRFCTRAAALARLAASLAVLSSFLFAVAGCEKIQSFLFDVPSDAPPIPPQIPAASGSARPRPPSSELADAGAAPARVPLDPKLRRALKLSPRRAAPSLVACGKGRIGVVTEDALLVRSTSAYAETLKFPLEGPRGVLALGDGSLVGIGAANTLRLLPHDSKPKLLPKAPFLPDSSLLADRVNPDRFWNLPRVGGTLFGFDAVQSGASVLGASAWIEIDGYDRRAIGSLRDGSFLYTSGTGFRQFYGAGKREPVLGDSRDVWRILPAARPDSTWVFSRNEARLYMVLGGKLEKQRTIALETTPFDAESSGNTLAVLELAQPDDAPWGFVLEVFDAGGKRRFRAQLEAVETFGADWAKRLSDNRAIAVCSEPRVVAVGGATHLDVWGTDKGERLFNGE
jgi:hypothetical protein